MPVTTESHPSSARHADPRSAPAASRAVRDSGPGAASVPLPQAVAACTGFAAFSISIVVGIASENATETVLLRAIGSLAFGFAGGFAVGLVCDWIARHGATRGNDAQDAVPADDVGESSAMDSTAQAASSSRPDLG